MRRAIVVPPVLAADALDELKRWLAITTTRDDASLEALLRAALDTCEAFTRIMPLEAECEEVLPAMRGWQSLVATPVQAITAMEAITSDSARTPLDPGQYLLDIAADGCGRVHLLASPAVSRVSVRFTAGLAPDWAGLPEGIRHGVLRLAAHHYRQRNEGGGQAPPAAVVALWQPWRRMRVA
ncbi:head-tail connector protein [Aurantiacibacter aquimixticola]|uniref:Phage gp6-like head-tail connector protein n=1 Tax=Aurantiacibacter aquimixticola TaxID=1958945 RepID=A0A419RV84_9SPHN|nr:phage head-tail connector protein [Aurantiacibacter aquimixticola]RJY09689.1 hypothetical protein D6201_10295 [Aurantiacibacter aquimixticola]